MLRSTFLDSFVLPTNGSVSTRFLMESPKTSSLSVVKPRTRSMLLTSFLKPTKPGRVSSLVPLTRRKSKRKFFMDSIVVRFPVLTTLISVNTTVEDSPYYNASVEVPAVSVDVVFWVIWVSIINVYVFRLLLNLLLPLMLPLTSGSSSLDTTCKCHANLNSISFLSVLFSSLHFLFLKINLILHI